MKKPILHLICNAHLDPVWQWQWEEGASETISTFRTAADLCDEFKSFVFNHNEVILYKWVEEYEPKLFKRIQNLVKRGQWHIMGGWYLQPDCNMPSGEGFVRQALAGRSYFKEKFGVRPTTAINFDPFGHTRGLVQILVKSGYDSYIHCRPSRKDLGQDADEYVWTGYDGSEIIAVRPVQWYNSRLGAAGEKLKKQLTFESGYNTSIMLWGVGNHGGGPSRKDIRDINRIISREKKQLVSHSTPEAYFKDLKKHKSSLPRWEQDMNPWAVGCYTSMIRVKQGFRRLENELFKVEKMASAAAASGLIPYPGQELKEAEEVMLWTAFHDVLPGSSIQPVEEHTLHKLGHAMEILSRVRTRAFFSLAGGQPKAKPDTFPILVHNPHPWPVEVPVTGEFNLPDIILCPDTFWVPSLTHKGKKIPVQAEHPDSNIPFDWRKRVVFNARLAPGSMNRFDIKLTRKLKRPAMPNLEKNGKLRIRGKDIDWAINLRTGLVEHLRINRKNILRAGAFKGMAIADSPDPWEMTAVRFDKVAGNFRLLSQAKSAEVSGVDCKRLKPVRIVEHGPVRTVVEALYGYNDSFMIMTWKLPKTGTDIELEIRVLWNEKDTMLKLSVPTALNDSVYMGEVAYGRDKLYDSGDETVAQKWTAVVSKEDDIAFTAINDSIYGSSFHKGEMRMTLLRSPAYTSHPISDWQMLPDTMFRPRMDQGERIFRLWFNAGPIRERLDAVAREAHVYNEFPMTLWFNPSGKGKRTPPFAVLSNKRIQMTAVKQAEDGKCWIVRLFEPTGRKQKTGLKVAAGKKQKSLQVTLNPFEIKTFKFSSGLGTASEVNLMEE